MLASCGSTPDAGRGPAPECAPQVCHSTGDCDAVLGHGKWTWDGSSCHEFYASGCGLEGADCARLFDSEEACAAAYLECGAGR
ncbi:MAG: hypothetical protein DRJ42_19160 [Deltaproteobacteria bacterium]|nr:MAG: hypothetical protein DRJ42_19160 [Deltaproteobacteria bacterium]